MSVRAWASCGLGLLGALLMFYWASPGLNGLIFATITYLLLRFRERFAMYGAIQQVLIVFTVTGSAQLLRSFSLNFFS